MMKIEKMKKEKETWIGAFQELIAMWKLLDHLQDDMTHLSLILGKNEKARQAYNHMITAFSDYENAICIAVQKIYGNDSDLLKSIHHDFTEIDKIHIQAILEDKYTWLFE